MKRFINLICPGSVAVSLYARHEVYILDPLSNSGKFNFQKFIVRVSAYITLNDKYYFGKRFIVKSRRVFNNINQAFSN